MAEREREGANGGEIKRYPGFDFFAVAGCFLAHRVRWTGRQDTADSSYLFLEHLVAALVVEGERARLALGCEEVRAEQRRVSRREVDLIQVDVLALHALDG